MKPCVSPYAVVVTVWEPNPQSLAAYYVSCLKAYIDAMKAVDSKIEIIVDGNDGSMRGVGPLVLEQLRGRSTIS